MQSSLDSAYPTFHGTRDTFNSSINTTPYLQGEWSAGKIITASEKVPVRPQLRTSSAMIPESSFCLPTISYTSNHSLDNAEDSFDPILASKSPTASSLATPNEPIFSDSQFSSGSITRISSFVTDIISQTYIMSSTSHPPYPAGSQVSPSSLHISPCCCSVCANSGMYPVAVQYMNSFASQCSNRAFRPSIDSPFTFAKAMHYYQKEIQVPLEHAISFLQRELRVRLVEVATGALLFEDFCKQHWRCATFVLFRTILKTIFVVCVMIAHKLSADHCLSNKHWAQKVNIAPDVLNEYERDVLAMLNYNVFVDHYRYTQFTDAVLIPGSSSTASQMLDEFEDSTSSSQASDSLAIIGQLNDSLARTDSGCSYSFGKYSGSLPSPSNLSFASSPYPSPNPSPPSLQSGNTLSPSQCNSFPPSISPTTSSPYSSTLNPNSSPCVNEAATSQKPTTSVFADPSFSRSITHDSLISFDTKLPVAVLAGTPSNLSVELCSSVGPWKSS